MTKIKRLFMSTVLILFAIGIALIVWCCKNMADKSALKSNLDLVINNYQEEKAPYIDLAGINYFSWDRVFIFGPYSDCDKIIKVLDAEYFWFECKFSGIEDYESLSLFVFKENGRIVRSTTYSGSTINRNNQNGYIHESAFFIFDETGRMVWVENK